MSTKMLDEMRSLMRRRHDSIHTERAYRDGVKRHVRFHNFSYLQWMRRARTAIIGRMMSNDRQGGL